MKNLFLILSLIAFTVFAKAQIYKGRQMIGCNFNFSTSKSRSFDSTGTIPMTKVSDRGMNLGLRYGYCISNNVMLGLFASLNTSNSQYEQRYYNASRIAYENHGIGLGAGAFARYYNMLGKSKFAVFGQLSASYFEASMLRFNLDNNPTVFHTSKTVGISGGLSAGITYFLNKTFAIETSAVSLAIIHSKSASFSDGIKNNENSGVSISTTSIFSLSSINIGLNFYFGGKRKEAETPITP